jgi:nucleotide-binding universal stress UspA family protein
MDHVQGTIIVGIDGSSASSRALHWAADRAAAEHRALTLAHTISVSAQVYLGPGTVTLAEAREALEGSGRAMLEAARKAVHEQAPEVEVHEVLEYADPADFLVKMSQGAAMVVVGSRGRGPIRSKLLGSVSIRLVRQAHCPVVVVRPGNVGTVRNGVAVGLDALPESQPVLEFAYREASLRGLPLTVLHAAWSPTSGTMEAVYLPVSPDDRESERLALAESMAGMAEKYPDVRATSRLSEGRPDELLVKVGERMDLVVLGSHQPHGLERVLFGSVAVAVVEEATCPVAVVPVGSGPLAAATHRD